MKISKARRDTLWRVLGVFLVLVIVGVRLTLAAREEMPSTQFWCVLEHVGQDNGHVSGKTVREALVTPGDSNHESRMELEDLIATFSAREKSIILRIESRKGPKVVSSAVGDRSSERLKVERDSRSGESVDSFLCERRS